MTELWKAQRLGLKLDKEVRRLRLWAILCIIREFFCRDQSDTGACCVDPTATGYAE